MNEFYDHSAIHCTVITTRIVQCSLHRHVHSRIVCEIRKISCQSGVLAVQEDMLPSTARLFVELWRNGPFRMHKVLSLVAVAGLITV